MRLISLLVLVLVAGCASRPPSAWQPGEAEAVAWWCEDVAHGLDRDPGEIDLVAGSPRAAMVARWAAGSEVHGRWDPPRRLAARRARWPKIAAAIAAGSVLAAEDSGLLVPFPGLMPAQRAAIAALVDAENDDRRFLDAVIRAAGHPDPAVEQVHIEAVRCARHIHDAPPNGGGVQEAPATR